MPGSGNVPASSTTRDKGRVEIGGLAISCKVNAWKWQPSCLRYYQRKAEGGVEIVGLAILSRKVNAWKWQHSCLRYYQREGERRGEIGGITYS
jgi:hypothetical protein